MKKARNNIILIFAAVAIFFLIPLIVIAFPETLPFFSKNILKLFILLIFFLTICFINLVLAGPKSHTFSKISIGQIPKEFDEVFDEIKNQDLTKVPKVKKMNIPLLILKAILIFIISFIIVKDEIDGFIQLPIIITFIFLYFELEKYKPSIKEYTKFYKETYIKKLIELSFPNLKYEIEIDEENLKEMKTAYITANFDVASRIEAEDFIQGYYEKNCYFKMADIKSKTENDSYFSGIFAYTKIEKVFDERIVISANKEDTSGNYKKITMDSTEFEKYFDIYSKDKMLTYKILTSDTMLKLYNWHKKHKLQFDIIIFGDFIGIRFFTYGEFEPYNYDGKIDKQIFYRHYSLVEFIGELLDMLKNTIDEIEL